MKHIFIMILFLSSYLPVFSGEVFTVTRIIDGDTIKVWDGIGEEKTVRLANIDTPETRRNDKAKDDALKWRVSLDEIVVAGEQAKWYVMSIMPPGVEIRLFTDSRIYDKYGRTLAYVYLMDGMCLNEMLLRQGYARVYSQGPFPLRERYLALEATARRERRHFWKTIWSDKGSNHE